MSDGVPSGLFKGIAKLKLLNIAMFEASYPNVANHSRGECLECLKLPSDAIFSHIFENPQIFQTLCKLHLPTHSLASLLFS